MANYSWAPTRLGPFEQHLPWHPPRCRQCRPNLPNHWWTASSRTWPGELQKLLLCPGLLENPHFWGDVLDCWISHGPEATEVLFGGLESAEKWQSIDAEQLYPSFWDICKSHSLFERFTFTPPPVDVLFPTKPLVAPWLRCHLLPPSDLGGSHVACQFSSNSSCWSWQIFEGCTALAAPPARADFEPSPLPPGRCQASHQGPWRSGYRCEHQRCGRFLSHWHRTFRADSEGCLETIHPWEPLNLASPTACHHLVRIRLVTDMLRKPQSEGLSSAGASSTIPNHRQRYSFANYNSSPLSLNCLFNHAYHAFGDCNSPWAAGTWQASCKNRLLCLRCCINPSTCR